MSFVNDAGAGDVWWSRDEGMVMLEVGEDECVAWLCMCAVTAAECHLWSSCSGCYRTSSGVRVPMFNVSRSVTVMHGLVHQPSVSEMNNPESSST